MAKLVQRLAHQERPHNHVTAVFEAGTYSFAMPRRATFAQLAGRLARLGEQHGQVLTAVQVMKAGRDGPPTGAIQHTTG